MGPGPGWLASLQPLSRMEGWAAGWGRWAAAKWTLYLTAPRSCQGPLKIQGPRGAAWIIVPGAGAWAPMVWSNCQCEEGALVSEGGPQPCRHSAGEWTAGRVASAQGRGGRDGISCFFSSHILFPRGLTRAGDVFQPKERKESFSRQRNSAPKREGRRHSGFVPLHKLCGWVFLEGWVPLEVQPWTEVAAR